jgi:hypothetical protein
LPELSLMRCRRERLRLPTRDNLALPLRL